MPTTLYAEDGSWLRFDGVTAVRVTTSNTITRHPTERGVAITDHVQREPVMVSIVGVVTESPMQSQASLGGATDGLTGEARVRAATDWIQQHSGPRLTLETDGRDALDSLVIQRFPDESTVSRQRIITLELQQIATATAEQVAIPPELPPPATAHAHADLADLGEQAGVSGEEDAAQQVRDVSAASLLIGYLGG